MTRDEIIEKLGELEILAAAAKRAVTEGEFQEAVDHVDEGCSFDLSGGVWENLIGEINGMKS